jgi:hypothetical protein
VDDSSISFPDVDWHSVELYVYQNQHNQTLYRIMGIEFYLYFGFGHDFLLKADS